MEIKKILFIVIGYDLLPILCENDTAENGYIKCEIEEKKLCSKQF